MAYDIRLEQRSSRPLAVVRRRASLAELAKVVPDACGAVWAVVRAQKIAGAGRHVALYWDDTINLEVGVEGHWEDEWNRDPSKIRTDVFYLLKTPEVGG